MVILKLLGILKLAPSQKGIYTFQVSILLIWRIIKYQLINMVQKSNTSPFTVLSIDIASIIIPIQ